MRFTAATVALFAGLAAALPNGADTTVYETDQVTITSCGPTVTDCPASHSATPSAPAAVTTPAGESPAPTGPAGGESPAPSGPAGGESAVPSGPASSWVPSSGGAVPSQSTPVIPGEGAQPSGPAGGAQPSGPAGGAGSPPPQVVTVTSCVPTTYLSTIAPKPTASSPVGGNNGGNNGGVPHVPASSKGWASASAR